LPKSSQLALTGFLFALQCFVYFFSVKESCLLLHNLAKCAMAMLLAAFGLGSPHQLPKDELRSFCRLQTKVSSPGRRIWRGQRIAYIIQPLQCFPPSRSHQPRSAQNGFLLSSNPIWLSSFFSWNHQPGYDQELHSEPLHNLYGEY